VFLPIAEPAHFIDYPVFHIGIKMKEPKSLSGKVISLTIAVTRWWRLSLVLLLVPLLIVMPAQAAINYIFSPTGTLPAGCSLNSLSTTSFTCGPVTLAAGDTINVGTFTPVTVTFTGKFTTAAGNLLNTEGSSSDLNFVTNGGLTLGAKATLNANVTSTAAVNLGAKSTIGGNIMASTTTGEVNLGEKSTVRGNIQTGVAAISIHAKSKVDGDIASQDGAISLQTNVKVGGGISSSNGSITIGAKSSTCGSVSSTGSGIITITTDVPIGGDLIAYSGVITVNRGSSVVGDIIIITGAGAVTLTDNKVGGKISTSNGDITLTDSRVGESVASSGSGVVTLNSSVTNDTTLVLSRPPDCPAKPLVDHFQIEHDGTGLTCSAEILTLKACTDATCSTLYTEDIDVELSINDIPDKIVTVSGGTTIIDFSYTNADTATLSLDQTFECENGDSDSCDLAFADAGFRFLYGATEATSIGHQISGNNFAEILKLQAVENVNGVCTGLFAGQVDVQLSQQNITPSGIAELSFKLNSTSGTSIAKHPTFTPNITLDFDVDSKANIPMPVYLDAGQIRLHAIYNVAGVSLEGNSTDFWVSPAKLIVTATSGGSHISGDSDSSAIKHKAGQAFDFTVTAYNSLGTGPGNITANYVPNDIQLLLARTGPTAGGVNGGFNYGSGSLISSLMPTYQSVSLTAFNSGISATNSASYSEVGLLNLDLQDKNYGFSGNTILADTINIGRFTPDYFEQKVVEHGSLDAVCYQNDTFAYTGQVLVSDAEKGAIFYLIKPVVELTAKNVQGVTVQNYTETGYNKLIASANFIIKPTTDSSILGNDSHLLPLTANIFAGTLSNIGLATNDPSFDLPLGAGILHYELADDDNFFYPRNENSEVFAQDNDIDFLIDHANFVDSDSINISYPEDITSTTSINIRFGRVLLNNTFGPETDDFRQHLSAQYLNANNNYVVNKQDSCTKYDAGNTTLTSGTLNKNLTAVNAVIGQLEEGKTRMIILTAPGAGNQGTIHVQYDAYPWLEYNWGWNGIDEKILNEDPSATATFGLFRGNDKIVHIREIYH
jgi:hypothetical protein